MGDYSHAVTNWVLPLLMEKLRKRVSIILVVTPRM